MTRAPRRDVFRCATWLRVTVFVAAGLFLAILSNTSPSQRPWTFRVSVVLVVIGCVGVVESFMTRVELGEHTGESNTRVAGVIRAWLNEDKGTS